MPYRNLSQHQQIHRHTFSNQYPASTSTHHDKNFEQNECRPTLLETRFVDIDIQMTRSDIDSFKILILQHLQQKCPTKLQNNLSTKFSATSPFT